MKEAPAVRRFIEFLVRQDRKVDMKTEVATRRLERMEKEKDEQEDQEHEANLEEALADKTKVAKLFVDKWFADKVFGFGKVQIGGIVFIHTSIVHGGEVLMIDTDAWAQVVSVPRGCIEHEMPGDATLGKKRRTRRRRTEWPSKWR